MYISICIYGGFYFVGVSQNIWRPGARNWLTRGPRYNTST